MRKEFVSVSAGPEKVELAEELNRKVKDQLLQLLQNYYGSLSDSDSLDLSGLPIAKLVERLRNHISTKFGDIFDKNPGCASLKDLINSELSHQVVSSYTTISLLEYTIDSFKKRPETASKIGKYIDRMSPIFKKLAYYRSFEFFDLLLSVLEPLDGLKTEDSTVAKLFNPTLSFFAKKAEIIGGSNFYNLANGLTPSDSSLFRLNYTKILLFINEAINNAWKNSPAGQKPKLEITESQIVITNTLDPNTGKNSTASSYQGGEIISKVLEGLIGVGVSAEYSITSVSNQRNLGSDSENKQSLSNFSAFKQALQSQNTKCKVQVSLNFR